MFTVEFERIGYAPFILRAVSSATRPLLVEEVYAAWAASVTSSASHLVRWPAPGRAWETFESDVRALVRSGDLVTCADDEPASHPHHHLTRGHEGHAPFRHGPAPTVLRYLATPAGAEAWRSSLSDPFLRKAVLALTQLSPRSTPVGAGRR
ncbi:hypothetical protein [Paractinoplanes atraurantiacus]|uniref:Uncharacterized protein n=1 Tax=Paractinoplanes atraurantiacus TaxID=1036182 RepID=A0A285IYT0_9ACTN|nr:hypothetical protein [Actinoplanes atraurantiacus]SNY53144.1 hypothetical protein SAMN05421748_113194 [Actinoplanes atraurantiacus]